MKAILAIDGVSRVIEISDEEFMQGYIDIIYREPFIAKASKNEGCAVDNSTEAIKIRAIHHNAYIGNTPLFEADASTNKKDTNLKEMSAEELVGYRDDCREFLDEPFRSKENIDSYNDASKELISRLTRGEKAIKAMEEICQKRMLYTQENWNTSVFVKNELDKIIKQYRREYETNK